MVYLFFFKQKTAYEMSVSDWSSDVCSSDLLAALRSSVGVDDPTAVVADDAAALVEGDVADRPAAIPDRPQHQPALDGLLHVGRHGARPAVGGRLDPVAHDPDAGHRPVLALAEELHRRAQELQRDAVALAARRALGEAAQDVDVAPDGRLGLLLQPAPAVLVELELGGVDLDI